MVIDEFLFFLPTFIISLFVLVSRKGVLLSIFISFQL
jgi:hypothetical protein